jgi:hypothetical protein
LIWSAKFNGWPRFFFHDDDKNGDDDGPGDGDGDSDDDDNDVCCSETNGPQKHDPKT